MSKDKTKNVKIKNPIRKRSHKLRNTFLIIFGILMTGVISVAGVAYANARAAAEVSHKDLKLKATRNVASVLKSKKPVSILLMGTDTGELGRNYVGRTDSMMLVTVNPKKKTTTMVSIPRDSMVSVPGNASYFPQKINAAYEFSLSGGGFSKTGHPETTVKLLQEWLNIPIDFYALVNMGALQKIVDQIGGVSVVSPLTFKYDPDSESNPGRNLYSFTAGSTTFTHTTPSGTTTQDTMDGAAALAFARMRKTDPKGDYGRQERQRLILQAITKKPAELASQALNQKFLKSLATNLQTNLTFDDMTALATSYRGALKNMTSESMQGSGIMYKGVSYQIIGKIEKQRITDLIRKSLSLETEDTGTDFGGTVPTTTRITLGDTTILQ